MNALELIETVRSYKADLVVESNKLIVRGRGKRLPAELQAALKRHKAELLVALGAPREVTMIEILQEIRPYLPVPLRNVSDASLLALVNYSMLQAWSRAASQLGSPSDSPRCSRCGVVMSKVRVSNICGRCAR